MLLERLPRRWTLLGVDPSDIARTTASRGAAYELHNVMFTQDFLEEAGLCGTLDVISGSNCLAHISDLRSVFEAVHSGLRAGGHFWLEVHDSDALLTGAQWDTIYHEHKAEWGEDSLRHCILPIGFAHVETQRLPLHGGLIRVCFEKRATQNTIPRGGCRPDPRLARLRESYSTRYETPAAKTLAAANQAHRPIAAYGAAGRASVFLNQLSEIHVDYVVDESPARVHRFLPRLGTPIVLPEKLVTNPVDACLITAWNYKLEIIAKNKGFLGQWLTAF